MGRSTKRAEPAEQPTATSRATGSSARASRRKTTTAGTAAPAPLGTMSAEGNDVGVDPHKKTLTASVLDRRGGVLATASFKVSGEGHRAMEAWVAGLGPVRRFGIEGASSLGRHTAMYLIRAGYDVRDVCPNRANERDQGRRRGKSDAIDSVKIAREVQADPDLPVAFKRASGDAGPDETTECLAVCHQARRSLLKSRQHLLNEAESILMDLPEAVTAALPDTAGVRPRLAALVALGAEITAGLGRADRVRVELLARHHDDVAALDRREVEIAAELGRLVRCAGSTLSELCGIAERSDAELLVEVGDPPPLRRRGRLRPLQRHRPPPRVLGRGRRPTAPPPPQPGREPQGQRHLAPHGRHPAALRAQGPHDLRQRPEPRAHQERGHASPQASPLQRRLPADARGPQPSLRPPRQKVLHRRRAR